MEVDPIPFPGNAEQFSQDRELIVDRLVGEAGFPLLRLEGIDFLRVDAIEPEMSEKRHEVPLRDHPFRIELARLVVHGGVHVQKLLAELSEEGRARLRRDGRSRLELLSSAALVARASERFLALGAASRCRTRSPPRM